MLEKGQKITKNISYTLQFVDSAKFMASSLSNLVKSISEKIHKRKNKYWHDDKNYGITYEVCHCFLEYKNIRDDLIEHVCAVTKLINKFDEKLKDQFLNSHKCSNYDNNKFVLLLEKVFCPYEYVADWEELNETSLPEKEDFYIHLNVEDITDADYVHAKRVTKKFKNKNLGEDHDLHVHKDTLLSAGPYKKYIF